jgi:hypothetical protein
VLRSWTFFAEAEGARRTADLFIIKFEQSAPGIGQGQFDQLEKKIRVAAMLSRGPFPTTSSTAAKFRQPRKVSPIQGRLFSGER